MSRRKHVFPSPTVARKLDAEPREINQKPADAKAPTYERKPLNEDSPLRRAWAKGLTPSSPAAVPKKDAVNALREATERRGVVGAVFCAGWKTTLWCGRAARSLSAWAYPRLLSLFGSARGRFWDCEAGGGAPEDHQA